MWFISVVDGNITANVQGFAQVGYSMSRLPEPSAEDRMKKLIICSFADRLRSARTADGSSATADVFPSAPLAQNRLLGACQANLSRDILT